MQLAEPMKRKAAVASPSLGRDFRSPGPQDGPQWLRRTGRELKQLEKVAILIILYISICRNFIKKINDRYSLNTETISCCYLKHKWKAFALIFGLKYKL